MRPGITVDWDHLSRFERYVIKIRERFQANTGGRFKRASGYLVADKLSKSGDISTKIKSLTDDQMWALEWKILLNQAWAQWEEFLDVLKMRAPEDERLQSLQTGSVEAAAAAELIKGPSIQPCRR